MTAPSFDVEFTAKQSDALQSEATEILYGGAAGGGKSYFMRALAILLCMLIPGLNVYLFRRTYDDLIKNHMEGTGGFPEMLAGLIASKHVQIVENEIRFWTGSKIFLCHCQHEKDRFKYQGAEIHILLVDEATMFTDRIYRFLRGRMRKPPTVPQWAEDFFQEKFGVSLTRKIPLAILGSNPGNIGHQWVKSSFIDGVLPMDVRRMPAAEGGMLRQYIPALLSDNEHIDAEDYAAKLSGLGNPALVRAMLNGDWNVVAGAFFDILDDQVHKVPAFTVPAHWTRYRSMDWGSRKPFSVGWWCIAEGGEWVKCRDGKERMFPQGALIRYREWYGVKKDEHGKVIPDEGLRLSPEAVGRGIMEREAGEKIDESLSVADPAMWKEDGGPSFAERIAKCDPKQPNAIVGPRFKPADNSRVQGWQQMYDRLKWQETDTGQPMLYVVDACHDWWRTVPALMHDETKPEDLDSRMEDHCFAADTLVDTPDGLCRIVDMVGTDPVVMTSAGPTQGIACRLTRRNADVVRVTFEDGTQVVCTPDHQFESAKGWVQAVDLLDAVRYDWIWSKSSARLARSSKVSGTTGAGGTSSARGSGFTGLSGCSAEALFLMDSMCTTSTTTPPTTSPKTSSSSKHDLTSCITGASQVNAAWLRFPLRALQLLGGMVRRLAGSGTACTTSATVQTPCTPERQCSAPTAQAFSAGSTSGRSSAPTLASQPAGEQAKQTTCSGFVQSANAPSASGSTPLPRHAASNAGLSWQALRVLSVEPAGKADVYCLTVPSGQAFTIEGGISVHNCGDETRYACMARPVSRVPKPRQLSGPKPFTLDWVMAQR